MRHALPLAVLALLVLTLAGPAQHAVSAVTAPTLTLNPSSGNAPEVLGTAGGTGWICDGGGVPAGSAAVTGAGVSGSATISAAGVVTGSFRVSGVAGQEVVVRVTSQPCPGFGPPQTLTTTAMFTFNTPSPTSTSTPTVTPVPTATATPTAAVLPTWTPTAAVIPTWTPTAALLPTRPPPAPTAVPTEEPAPDGEPPPPVPSAVTQITFTGCTPSKAQIEFEFTPLYLIGVGEPGGQPPGPAVLVTARKQAADPQTYTFDSPVVDAGLLFQVRSKTADPACPPLSAAGQSWVAGNGMEILLPLPGNTSLEACALGDKSPCEQALVKGASVRRGEEIVLPAAGTEVTESSWVLELGFYKEDLAGRKQRFHWSAELSDVKDVKLQASVWPFPNSAEQDFLAPPGLIVSWDVHFDKACTSYCEFVVPLKDLDPSGTQSNKNSKSIFKKALDTAATPFKLAGKGISGLFGGKKKSTSSFKATKPQFTDASPVDYYAGGKVVSLQPSTYYFRVVPLKDGQPQGAPSNVVVMKESDPSLDQSKIKFQAPSPTPVVQHAYEAKFIQYHGILPPVAPSKNCYIVTQEAWPVDYWGLNYTTEASQKLPGSTSVKPGQLICEPPPDEPSLLNVIISWASGVWNWASQAWADIKAFAVKTVLKYTGLGAACGEAEGGLIPPGTCEAALNTALNAALVAIGVPPDLPNLETAMDEGIVYVAAQAAAQVSIPPEVIDEAIAPDGAYAAYAKLGKDYVEQKLREEVQKELETDLKATIKSIGVAYSKKVSFVPDGIPVRPDDYQQPMTTVRVTRKAGVAGGDQGCDLDIVDETKLSSSFVTSPPPELSSFINGLPQSLNSVWSYNLYPPAKLNVPALAPGQHIDIPIVFVPDYYNSGWKAFGSVNTSLYIGVWNILHDFGSLSLHQYGSCGLASFNTAADSNVYTPEFLEP